MSSSQGNADLGLEIAVEVARLHGPRLELAQPTGGGGPVIGIEMPAAAD